MRSLAQAGRAVLVLVLCSCASSAPTPVVSPTGHVYELGTPPTETRNSQTATLYLRQDRADRALDLALDGIAADTTNPIHYFLAGVAHARLGDYERADAMFRDAERIYPAYELEIEPEREAAWGSAFNAGLEAYENGDVEETIEIWTQATRIYDLRSEAHSNLAGLLALEGRYPEAIAAYEDGLAGLEKRPATRVLTEEELTERRAAAVELEEGLAQLLLLTDRFAEAEPLLRRQLARDSTSVDVRADLAMALSGLGRGDEARAIYSTLLSDEALASAQLYELGVGLFRAGDFPGAAEAFRRLTVVQPDSRDAWFNYVNALFASEEWSGVANAAERLHRLDPLGESTGLITARALLETGEREAALERLDRTEGAPVYVEDLQMRSTGLATTVQGSVTGNVAEPGTELRLRFVFYGEAGMRAGEETVVVRAPAPGESVPFRVVHPTRAAAYRYELLP